MAEPRKLMKYKNRRLYDTHLSRYITLLDVKALVLTGEPFVILDSQTNADCTDNVLLRVIRACCTGALSRERLLSIIRVQGDELPAPAFPCAAEEGSYSA